MNSGSSANLLAVHALALPEHGARRLRPGDEVLTVAAAFPTTVAPILQAGAIPVFVDVRPDTANVNADRLAEAVTPKTRAIVLAHTLGNPFELDRVAALARADGRTCATARPHAALDGGAPRPRGGVSAR